MRLLILPVVAILATVGCKSEEPVEEELSPILAYGSEIAGIYTLDTYADNPDACTEAASDLGAANFTELAVDGGSFFGVDFVQALGCSGSADCLEALDTDLTIGSDAWFFEEISGEVLTGSSAFVFSSNDTCEGTVITTTMTVAGTTLTIREESVEVGGFAPDSDGFCDTDAAIAASAGQPCTALRVLTATFSEGV